MVEDDYADRFGPREAAALALTDVLIGPGETATPELQDALLEHYSADEIAELALGVGCFLGMSKVLIALGLEPEEMETTVLPTPGSIGA